VYNGDVFNEMSPPSSAPEYITNISSAIFETLKAGDPEAVWLMQAWQFLSDYWKNDLIEAWLKGLFCCYEINEYQVLV